VSYREYWNSVVGEYDAKTVVAIHALQPYRRGLDEWLGECEEAAVFYGAKRSDDWDDYRYLAMGELLEAMRE
jgi:hypothetical protein